MIHYLFCDESGGLSEDVRSPFSYTLRPSLILERRIISGILAH